MTKTPTYSIRMCDRPPRFAFRYAVHIWRTFTHGPDTLIGVGVGHTKDEALAPAIREVRYRRHAGGDALGLNP